MLGVCSSFIALMQELDLSGVTRAEKNFSHHKDLSQDVVCKEICMVKFYIAGESVTAKGQVGAL